MNNTIDDLDELEEEQLEGLAELIKQRFDNAKSARNETFFADKSIDEWLKESYERYTANHCNTHFNLVRIKVDVVHAKVKDMTIGSIDAPFVIKPTPIPELSKEQTESIQLDLEDTLAKKLLAEGIVIVEENGEVKPRFDVVMEKNKLLPEVSDWLREQAKLQKKSQQFEAGRIASESAENATVYMLDQLHEGHWKQANLDADFDDFLYGTGCIKEEEKLVPTLKWEKGKLIESTESRITYRHVPIHNCYPSPDSEHAQKGTYFIEVAKMRKQDLWACTQIDWFDEDRLKEAFAEANENRDWLSDNPEQHEGWGDDELVDVLIHQGSVSGETLNEYFGYDKDSDEDDQNRLEDYEFYDVECYLLADIVIGCRLLKFPHGRRSYYSSNYKSAGKSFWGIGLAMLLAEREDKLNQYEKDLQTNLDKTINPPIFYNIERFDKPEHVQQGLAEKGGLIPFNPDPANTGNPSPPYYQVRFDSKSNELTSLFSRDYRLADDESGIPSLLSGNSDLRGGEATFRGMKLLAATSNIIIKSYFHNKDETRIQPAMQNLWAYNMVNSDDETIKGDVNIIARGTAGLMQQEIANAERLEALPIISQLLGASSLDDNKKAQVIDYLLRETMIEGGIPAQQLMSDPAVTAEQNAMVADLKAQIPQQQMQQTQGLPMSEQQMQATTQPLTPYPTIGADTDTGGLQ